jgi:hypothetical protein
MRRKRTRSWRRRNSPRKARSLNQLQITSRRLRTRRKTIPLESSCCSIDSPNSSDKRKSL